MGRAARGGVEGDNNTSLSPCLYLMACILQYPVSMISRYSLKGNLLALSTRVRLLSALTTDWLGRSSFTSSTSPSFLYSGIPASRVHSSNSV